MEATAPWVVEAAREHLNVDGDVITPRRLQNEEIESKILQSDVIICAFDTSVQSTLNTIISAGATEGPQRTEKPFPDNSSLVRLLEANVWSYLANIQALDANKMQTIRISSGDTCNSLTQFKDALRRFANSDIVNQSHEIVPIGETAFWTCTTKSRTSSRLTGSYYNLVSGEQFSEIDTASSSNTFPRRGARPPQPRLRSQSDITNLFTPRTVPSEKPKDTDKYTRQTSNYDSETSNSTEDGNRR